MGELGIIFAARVSELSVIAACVTAFCLAGGLYLAFRKAPIERDGVYISTAEGATRILNSAMVALEKDLERKAMTIEGLEATIKRISTTLNQALESHRIKDGVIEGQEARIQALELQLKEAKP